MKALLILDIQNDFTGPAARMPVDPQQAAQMIAHLNSIINRTGNEMEIIYIGNEFPAWDPGNLFRRFAAIRGSAGAKQDERLVAKGDCYFSKKSSSAFSNPSLDTYLKTKQVDELVITGVFAEACVWQTMKAAIRKGYRVGTIADCVAAASDAKRTKMLGVYRKAGITVADEWTN